MVTLREEKKLWKNRYKWVAGIDETGRGPLAGPVVACVFLVEKSLNSKFYFPGIKDSKKLLPQKREEFYQILTNHPAVEWATAKVSERVIDKINILEATKLAMKRAVRKLRKKPDFLIIDGNFNINLDIPQKPVIKADEKVFSCVAASIIAKVYRDRLMKREHKKYSQYGFDKHKGYPTKLHCFNLRKYGPCKIHRRSFKPVKVQSS